MEIEIPENVRVEILKDKIKVSGNEGIIEKRFDNNLLEIEAKDNKILIREKIEGRKYRALSGTYRALIRNMMRGVNKPYVYKMKIVNAHFPMNVKVDGNKLVISNFLGEKSKREVDLIEGVNVEVKGDEIILKGIDKEKVGLCAGRIEKLCYKGRKDLRKFQDGIYLVSRDED